MAIETPDVFLDPDALTKPRSQIMMYIHSKKKTFTNSLKHHFTLDNLLKFLHIRHTLKSRLREITIRNSDNDGKPIILNVLWPCECFIIKKKLQSFAGVRADNQRLVFKGRILKDDEIIPEEVFKMDFKDAITIKNKKKRALMLLNMDDGIEFNVWMANVGFSADKYKLKEKKSRKNLRRASGIVLPGDSDNSDDNSDEDEDSDDGGNNLNPKLTEEEQLALDTEMREDRLRRQEVDLIIKYMVTEAEKRVIAELTNDDDDPKKQHRRFDIHKEMDLIGCGIYADGLIKMGFGERGSFSCVQDEHIIGFPLYIHNKSRKKIVGLANAYKRQLQYEEGQQKNALSIVNDVEFAKKYTVDGKEFFHSRAEMIKFYEDIEDDRSDAQKKSSTKHQEVKEKFKKIKGGMNFMALAQKERPAKPHNAILEEKIVKITKYNEKDKEGYGLPTRANLTSVQINQEYKDERLHEYDLLFKTKKDSWTSALHDALQLVDAFGTGIIPKHDLRDILQTKLEQENVHNIPKKVEGILSRADDRGDGIYHDNKRVVQFCVEEMLSTMNLHIRGEQLRVQANRLKEEELRKKNKFYWVKDVAEEKEKEKNEREKLTPFNCPAFKAQPFNNRMCQTCAHDRNQHTMVHTKQDYVGFLLVKKKDAMDAQLELNEANELLARQNMIKQRLADQAGKHGKAGGNGIKLDWENIEVGKKK